MCVRARARAVTRTVTRPILAGLVSGVHAVMPRVNARDLRPRALAVAPAKQTRFTECCVCVCISYSAPEVIDETPGFADCTCFWFARLMNRPWPASLQPGLCCHFTSLGRLSITAGCAPTFTQLHPSSPTRVSARAVRGNALLTNPLANRARRRSQSSQTRTCVDCQGSRRT